MPEPARSPDLDKAVEEAVGGAIMEAWPPLTRDAIADPESWNRNVRSVIEAALPHLPSPEQEGEAIVNVYEDRTEVLLDEKAEPITLRSGQQARLPDGYKAGRSDALREVEEALIRNRDRQAGRNTDNANAMHYALDVLRDRFRAGGES